MARGLSIKDRESLISQAAAVLRVEPERLADVVDGVVFDQRLFNRYLGLADLATTRCRRWMLSLLISQEVAAEENHQPKDQNAHKKRGTKNEQDCSDSHDFGDAPSAQ